MYINTFKYTPKDVSCQLCTEYVKKLGCTALRCPWLAERIEAGVVGYTAALYLPPPGHRNYFVDLHIVYPGDDTRGTLCLNLYRYNESQRIDCGYVLAKNTSEHYHYIR